LVWKFKIFEYFRSFPYFFQYFEKILNMEWINLSHWEAVEIAANLLVKLKPEEIIQQLKENFERNEKERKKKKGENPNASKKAQLKEERCIKIIKENYYTLEKLYNTETLFDQIINYCDADLSAALNTLIFKNSNKFIYNFFNNIKIRAPHLISQKQFMQLEEFIFEKGKSPFKKKSLPNWNPSQKADLFINTNWYLYYYDEKLNRDGTKTQGIVQSILKIGTFRKTELEDFNLSVNAKRYYKGRIHIHLNTAGFLHLNLNSSETVEKDLSILLNVGEGNGEILPEIVLGQYHNRDAFSIFSGTLILRPIQNEALPEPCFCPFDDASKFQTIDPTIWQYFNKKERNLIKTPQNIYSLERFSSWLASKNKN